MHRAFGYALHFQYTQPSTKGHGQILVVGVCICHPRIRTNNVFIFSLIFQFRIYLEPTSQFANISANWTLSSKYIGNWKIMVWHVWLPRKRTNPFTFWALKMSVSEKEAFLAWISQTVSTTKTWSMSWKFKGTRYLPMPPNATPPPPGNKALLGGYQPRMIP